MSLNSGRNYDILIIGGGVIGCSIAYFLSTDSSVSIAVVEADSSYEWSATPRSAGGIRTQFSTAMNVKMSLFGAEFFRSAADLLEVAGDRPEIGFQENGYLILADEKGTTRLRSNHQTQVESGAQVDLLRPKEISRRFPWLDCTGLDLGAIGNANEGWLDPHGLLQALRKKARSKGVMFISDLVVNIIAQGSQIVSVELDSGTSLRAGIVINAAGVHGADILKMVTGETLPVEQKKRQIFAFDCHEKIEGMPLIVDPSGLYFRPENEMFICGLCPPKDEDPTTDSYVVDYNQFEEEIWPLLAQRVPAFEAIKMSGAWAGHYDLNIVDQNPVLGFHPTVTNFVFANGFSGHGLQHGPAVGRSISELILTGTYRSQDLSAFHFDRFASGNHIIEQNVF